MIEISDIRQAVVEVEGWSDNDLYRIWNEYQRQTMDFQGCVVREDDWSRFKEWLFSSPFLYYSSHDLLTAIRRRLNISELIVLDNGQLASFEIPEGFDRQYLVSSFSLGKYLLIQNPKAKQIVMPSLIECPLYDFDEYINNKTWCSDAIDIVLEAIKDDVLSPLRHTHDSRCDINNIRLYIRPTIPSDGCLIVGVLVECRETGSKVW